MVIINKNGQFDIGCCHYNWLMATIPFNEITAYIVNETRFIVSTYEYKKADKWYETYQLEET